MKLRSTVRLSLSILALGALTACSPAPAPEPMSGGAPHVMGADDIDAGRYLVVIGGCNDCHTDGYLETGGQVPEDQWLLGSSLGWRGPWGTTYPRNLRLSVQDWTEDQWVETLRTRTGLPPMPWMGVNHMSERDARVMYRYVRSLGPAGQQTPDPVPPGVEPTTPYLNMEPVMPAGM